MNIGTKSTPKTVTRTEMIKTGGIFHDGDRTFRKHIRSVTAKERERGWRISKLSSKKQIDAAIALAMAVYGATVMQIDVGDTDGFEIW